MRWLAGYSLRDTSYCGALVLCSVSQCSVVVSLLLVLCLVVVCCCVVVLCVELLLCCCLRGGAARRETLSSRMPMKQSCTNVIIQQAVDCLATS